MSSRCHGTRVVCSREVHKPLESCLESEGSKKGQLMKCKDCIHFDPWTTDYVGKDKKPFRHMLGNFGERGDKGMCREYGYHVFGEDATRFCDGYKPKAGELF